MPVAQLTERIVSRKYGLQFFTKTRSYSHIHVTVNVFYIIHFILLKQDPWLLSVDVCLFQFAQHPHRQNQTRHIC